MRVPSLQHIAAVVFEEDVFPVVDIPLRLPVLDLFNPPAQPVIPISRRERGHGIPRDELFHLRESVLRVVRVRRVIPCGGQRLARQVPVVVVLIRMG